MSQNALNALNSMAASPGESALFIVGPGEDTGFGGETHMVITTQRVCFVVKEGSIRSSFQTHLLAPLRDVQTLSIDAKWKWGMDSSRPQIALKINSFAPFKFRWGDTCDGVIGNPQRLSLFNPIDLWHNVIINAEGAKGKLQGGLSGYPAAVIDAMMLQGGEQVVDCLFGRIKTRETGAFEQVGGLLLTNARCIFFRRGTTSRLTTYGSKKLWNNLAGTLLADDGGYRVVKSAPLANLNQVAVVFRGSVPLLRLDNEDAFLPATLPPDMEKRIRGFADRVRQSKSKSTPVESQAAPVPLATGLACPKCGSSNDPSDSFCAQCGTALQAKCPNCGALLKAGAKFCGKCGSRLTGQE